MTNPSVAARPRGRLTALAGPAATAAAAVLAFAVVALVDPNEPGHYPTCPFLAVTGHYCPGCGSLRAMHALAHGDLGTAVGLNVLTVAALPVLGLAFARWTGRAWTGRPRPDPLRARWVWALLVVMVAFWVVRNLPVGSALAP